MSATRTIAKRSASISLNYSASKKKSMSLGALDKNASESTATNGVAAVALALAPMLQYNLHAISMTEVYNVMSDD